MKMEVITYAVAIAIFAYGIANPAQKHEDRTEKRAAEDSDNTRMYMLDEMQSGRSAYTTNTNLVGIRIVLNSIRLALWAILAILFAAFMPQILASAESFN